MRAASKPERFSAADAREAVDPEGRCRPRCGETRGWVPQPVDISQDVAPIAARGRSRCEGPTR